MMTWITENETMVMMTAILLLTGMLLIEVLRINRMQRRERRRDEAIRSIQADLKALCSGAVGVGDHVVNLEQKLHLVTERQTRMDTHTTDTRTYEHAIRLAQKGAGVRELMESCGLVQGEAELLLRMHGARQI